MQRWSEWLTQHRSRLVAASPWQWDFARTVLARVRGLDPAWVTVEHPFRDAAGRERRVDFAIQTPAGLRLALEVDGYDKQQRGTGMTKAEFEDFLARQNSVVNQGWHLLRFANAAVRDRPDECRDDIEAALAGRSTGSPVGADEQFTPTPPAASDSGSSGTADRIATRPRRALAWAAAGVTAVLLAEVGWQALSAGDETSDEAPPRSDGSCPDDFEYKANAES